MTVDDATTQRYSTYLCCCLFSVSPEAARGAPVYRAMTGNAARGDGIGQRFGTTYIPYVRYVE